MFKEDSVLNEQIRRAIRQRARRAVSKDDLVRAVFDGFRTQEVDLRLRRLQRILPGPEDQSEANNQPENPACEQCQQRKRPKHAKNCFAALADAEANLAAARSVVEKTAPRAPAARPSRATEHRP